MKTIYTYDFNFSVSDYTNELDMIKQITAKLVKFNQEYVCPFQSALLLK